jgi:hypothetical protein
LNGSILIGTDIIPLIEELPFVIVLAKSNDVVPEALGLESGAGKGLASSKALHLL